MRKAFFICIFFASVSSYAQDTLKTIAAVRTSLPIKIDGNLQDAAWQSAAVITGLVEQRPHYGSKEEQATKSIFRIIYDDNAVYVSGMCYEKRNNISTELNGRDNPGINDFAGVMFDTYRDKINGVGFYITALGEQYDCKYSLGNEDDSWSSVFYSATSITDEGWAFEMKIPYAALRFSKNEVQNWGINFIRKRAKAGKQFSWSPIDPNKFGLLNQAGLFTNISNIKSPVRLSLSPYLSSYYNHNYDDKGSPTHQVLVNGGMDIKYGVSKGFTLDMTLIPDFGQVQSDNQILNLTPFEIRYSENRPFFTEGIELFNKGNLFYSRRIGGRPLHYYDPYSMSNDSLILNPSETKLVNATKFSGRTAKGLGIGIFNAVTRPQYAELENKISHERSSYQTNPWTNYNILVLDQTLKNNSSVTFINTNVLRSGSEYDANVTALQYDLYDKNIDWNIWGKMANSRIYKVGPEGLSSGVNMEINLGRFKGPFNFEVHHYLADEKYQQNDMGYFTNNNYSNTGFGAWYKLNKPRSFYNNITLSLNGTYSMRFVPREYQYVALGFNVNSQLKNLWNVSINSSFRPSQNDFYEPRRNGYKFRVPSYWKPSFGISTNPTKKFYSSFSIGEKFSRIYASNFTDISISNRFRFNDKLTLSLRNYLEFGRNNAGYAAPDSTGEKIFFGLRNQRTAENVVSVKYNFNIKMGITLGLRHYWSKVNYHTFLLLDNDGNLNESNNTSLAQNPNNNVNFFNVDMVYTWQFAQGSFINISWKNAGYFYDQDITSKYANNLQQILKQPHQNNLSVKVIYFLDYLNLKKR